MRRPARGIAMAVGVVVTAFGVALATQVGNDPRADSHRSHLLGRPAPAFSLRTLDGETLTQRTFADRVVIVNFWNTWCLPCLEERPVLDEFAARHAADADVALLGIVRDDTATAVRGYLAAQPWAWTVALDPGSEAALAFGTRGQPETFVVSPGGAIVGVQLGPVSMRGLERMLAAARGSG